MGQVVSQFIRTPQALAQAMRDVAQEAPAAPGLRDGAIASSLHMLAPAPALELLAAEPIPPGVHFHSIIGMTSGTVPDGGDGVVSYRSAHMDGVESEVLVPSGHSTIQQNRARWPRCAASFLNIFARCMQASPECR